VGPTHQLVGNRQGGETAHCEGGGKKEKKNREGPITEVNRQIERELRERRVTGKMSRDPVVKRKMGVSDGEKVGGRLWTARMWGCRGGPKGGNVGRGGQRAHACGGKGRGWTPKG